MSKDEPEETIVIRILECSDIVWSKYGSDTIEELAKRIIKALKIGEKMIENIPTSAGITALAALDVDGEMPEIPQEKGHPTIKGNICGHDMGKDPKKYQPRNAPCMCGSGKKAKKCHRTLCEVGE